MRVLRPSPRRKILAAFACSMVSLLPMSGCTLCATGYIDDYATVGGKWQREVPTEGRVGSPFSDAGLAPGATIVEQPSYSAETVYEDGNDLDGMEFDSGGIEIYGDETFHNPSLDEVPYYDDSGEGW